jgi:CBS domain-containing protein
MTRRVRTIKPGDSVAHALAMLKRYRINQLPVIDNLTKALDAMLAAI